MSERRAGRSVFCVDRADEIERAKFAVAGHSTGERERKVPRWEPEQQWKPEHDAALATAPCDPCDPKVTGPEVYQYDTWAKRARDMTINGTTAGDNKEPPEHYNTSVQPIALIDAGEAAGMTGYYEGQIIKYVFRWRKKNGLRDLKAAAWFLNRMIAREEAKDAGPLSKYDAATIAAGADPKAHSCPHGASCDIHG